MAGPPPDTTNPNILRDTFAAQPFESHPDAWHSLYQHSFHPWDRGGPSMALSDLLEQRTDLVPRSQEAESPGERKTALVPGCGRGHDVILLRAFGYDVHGLDYSSDGIKLAKENVADFDSKNPVTKPAVDGVAVGSIDWRVADFFDDAWSKDVKYDLIFDYTFLCALPPQARPKWAKRMSELLSHKGRLICLEFPNGKPLIDKGPPWGLNPEVYEALLTHPGEELDYNDDGSVVDPPSPKPRDGALHRLCLIKPARTHPAGTREDGSVSDFISVWSH
ncbi:hypothetical protein Golomagni_06855 [Golovinomyces magnicellulatus]|nr:hypothetical protein Golomagni_06855 [Golovinomyces magnicellulatus]